MPDRILSVVLVLHTAITKVKQEESFAVYWISSKCREKLRFLQHTQTHTDKHTDTNRRTHTYTHTRFICIESAANAQRIFRENFPDS